MDPDSNQVSTSHIRSAVEFSPYGLIMADREGQIVLANREAERIFGYSQTELLGKSLEKLMPDFAAAGSGGESYGCRKDGSGTRVQFRMNTASTEDGPFLVISVLDVHASKDNEQLFRAAVESAPSGMVIVDGSGTITLVNRETERLFGYAREELLGKSVEILVPERFRSSHSGYREEFTERPSARRMGKRRDLYGLRKDGTEIPVEIGLNPIQTEKGLLVLSVIVDISERKRAEEALRTTAEELQRSNAELEQFAYIASHDLQEPLRMVTGFLQLLEQRNKVQLDEKAISYIDYAVNGAAWMSQLINDLLEYSRVQRKIRKPGTVDLNRALDLAVVNLRRSIAESSGRVIRDELPAVYGDSTQLTQLFQNLLGNAVKFHRKDVPPEIYIRAHRNGRNWIVSVSDNGIGISPEYVDRIFLIFQRLHSRNEYPGTGIGLAICKKIVEQLGGRIWVESNPGKGSTFYFTLPVENRELENF
jgi:PAS domain S-box-containing protein